MSLNSDTQKPTSSYNVLSWDDSHRGYLTTISSETMSEYFPAGLPDSSSVLFIDDSKLREVVKDKLNLFNDIYRKTQEGIHFHCNEHNPLTPESIN